MDQSQLSLCPLCPIKLSKIGHQTITFPPILYGIDWAPFWASKKMLFTQCNLAFIVSPPFQMAE